MSAIIQELSNLNANVTAVLKSAVSQNALLSSAVTDATARRDETQTIADSAAVLLNSAQQSADAAATTAAGLSGFDLSALAGEIDLSNINTAFVYDTANDTDGGAWREAAHDASWFNEAIGTSDRGATRAFPAVALIVAYSTKIAIFDATDPALPLWRRTHGLVSESGFDWHRSGRQIHSIAAKNGVIVFGQNDAGAVPQGALVMDLAGDRLIRFAQNTTFDFGPVSNDSKIDAGYTTRLGGLGADVNVNDVAIAVLDDAPINTLTGLAWPTIAVGTHDGVALIRHDGQIVRVTADQFDLHAKAVAFDSLGSLVVQMDSSDTNGRIVSVVNDYSSDVILTGADFSRSVADERYITSVGGAWAGDLTLGLRSNNQGALAVAGTDLVVGGQDGLAIIHRNPATPADSMHSVIAADYATGVLHGDVQGCWLASTDLTSLVEEDLIQNGTFDTDDTGWLPVSDGSITVSGGVAQINGNGVNFNGGVYQELAATIGQHYLITLDYVGGANFKLSMQGADFGVFTFTEAGPIKVAFKATSATPMIKLICNNPNAGAFCTIDNVSVKRIDPDRSGRENHAIVRGTLTAIQAENGELVGYTGTNPDNYIELPSGIEIPEKAVISFWSKGASYDWYMAANGAVQGPIVATTDGWMLRHTGPTDAKQVRFGYYENGSQIYGVTFTAGLLDAKILGRWCNIAVTRNGDEFGLWVDGELIEAVTHDLLADALDAGNSGPVLVRGNSGYPFALMKISHSLPTARQMRAAYNLERAMFADGAAVTLTGSSGNVLAAAVDQATGEVHAGTGEGRSTFDGLVRVASSATANTGTISASNKLIMEV